jgi:hypothetical protein
VATFPGAPPNPLGFKAELNLAGTWTDITVFVQRRADVAITGMGRADESNGISPCQLTLTLRNDGRFTPKNASAPAPYLNNILRNTQIRVSVSATSATGVAYSQFRFAGEVSSWPPAVDISGRDTYVSITASGIWRRISQSSVPIGSPYSRYAEQLTGTSVPASAWTMEDGSGSAVFVTDVGASAAAAFTGTPSFAADGTSFPGSDALPQFNGARITANVSSAATPADNVIRMALSVPAAGDGFIGTAEIGQVFRATTAGTIQSLVVQLLGNQLTIQGFSSGGTQLFTGTIATKVNGVPVLVSAELTPSGSSVAWALRIIKPGAGTVLDQVTGTRASASVGAVSQVYVNPQGRLTDTSGGQLGVFYAVPSLATAAAALGGFAGEFAVDRFTRLCAEFGIASTVIGSTSAAMGPQADDTLASILQSVEDTDGGLLYETRDQFGLGYRTLISLQNQSAAVTLNYTAGVVGAPPAPTYDDQLVKNSWTVTNTDGYAAQATLTSGALSVQAVPNGIGTYAGTAGCNASSHAQVNAIAQQRLFTGTVDDVRYPVITVNLARAQAAPLFASVPGLRVGDYLQVTNLPATVGGSATSKQLAWGYAETIGTNSWSISFNTVPELPFETAFSPGVFSVGQAATQGVASGSAVVSGAQIAPGSVGQPALSGTISARSVGGMTSFISAATPYDWSFAVSGVPADVSYFTCTEVQALPISVGDTFVNSGGLGGPFTVTSLDPPSGGNVSIHYTPDASSVMSSGTVFGGKQGDTWVNTSGGNQVNVWANGAWVPVTWTASSVLAATSITAGLIAAGAVIAGTIAAGAIDGMTITGVTLIADGTSGEILVYSGTPSSSNLIGSWSGGVGADAFGTAYAAGLEVQLGGLILDNQAAAPAAVAGASSFYSSVAGRPRYLSSAGADSIIERSTVNVSPFTVGNTTTLTSIAAPLGYLAGEAALSSEFEIEISGNGSPYGTSPAGQTTQQLVFDLLLDGVSMGVAPTVGAVFWQQGTFFIYTLRYFISVTASGASGTAAVNADGTISWSANKTNADSTTLNGIATGVAVDWTASHTFQVKARWGGSAASQQLTTYRTKLTRRD